MKLPRRQFLHLATGAAVLPISSRIAGAQTYPTRPITMVAPFAAGAPVDTFGRIVAERMRLALGQPIIVENVVGAAGSVGTGRAARAPADGYTISLGNISSHVLAEAIYVLQFDVMRDFEPVALLASNPQLVISKNAIPANDLKGLIAWLKANPDKASAGTAGAGGVSHVGGLLFQKETGTRFQFVRPRSQRQSPSPCRRVLRPDRPDVARA